METKKNITTNHTNSTTAYKPTVAWKSAPAVEQKEDNSLKREGRRTVEHDLQGTPGEIITQVEAVYDRMREAFVVFLAKKKWTNARAYREFSPYISNPAAVTKILKGEQRLAFEVLIIMALRFDEPLDEVLLGQKPGAPVLTTSEQEVILRLAEKIKSCSQSKR